MTARGRAELNRIYRQWQSGGDGVAGDEPCIEIWKFTKPNAGDDLGHKVFLRVVRGLERLQISRPTALSEDNCAYLSRTRRNAGRDQERRAPQHVAFSEASISKPGSFRDFAEFEGSADSTAVERLLGISERCINSLPSPIARALQLCDFDPAATVGATRDGSEAIKKRIQRWTSKCLLAFGAAALLGYPAPYPLPLPVLRLSTGLQGGPWEKLLALAPLFRDLSPNAVRGSATTLVEAAQYRPRPRIDHFLTSHAQELRDSVINEACAPKAAVELTVIAEHAARAAAGNRQDRRRAEKIRGSLIRAYDLNRREFSRRRDRVRPDLPSRNWRPPLPFLPAANFSRGAGIPSARRVSRNVMAENAADGMGRT